MNELQVKGTLVEWDECNAMQGGWGEDEVHCKDCTIGFMNSFQDDTGMEFELDGYLDGAHRGGFVPVIIHGVICEHCEKEIK
jgi:hypothetical protein